MDLLERFSRTKLGRVLMAESQEAESVGNERTRTAAQLREAEQRLEKEGLAMAKKLADAEAAIRQEYIDHARRIESLGKHYFEAQSKLQEIDARYRRLDGFLRKSASPQISGFIDWLFDEEGKTRRELSSTAERRRVDVGNAWEFRTVSVSNARAVDARLASLAKARIAAEALKLEILSEAEIAARLEQLRATIPAVFTLSVSEAVEY